MDAGTSTIAGWRQPDISNFYKASFGYLFYDQSGKFKPDCFMNKCQKAGQKEYPHILVIIFCCIGLFSGMFTVFDESGNFLSHSRW